MKKLILATILSAFAFTSFSAAYACDGMKGHQKADGTQAAKKQDGKKTDDAAKTDQQKS